MVLQSDSIAQKRYKRLARQNDFSDHIFLAGPDYRSSGRSRKPESPIIYRCKPKPLSLTGRQFKAEIYEIPADDSEIEKPIGALLTASSRDQDLSDEKSLLSHRRPVDQAADATSMTGDTCSAAAKNDTASSSAAENIEQRITIASNVPQPRLQNEDGFKSNFTPRQLLGGQPFHVSSLPQAYTGAESVYTEPDTHIQAPVAESSSHSLSTRALSTLNADEIVKRDSATLLFACRRALRKSKAKPEAPERAQRLGDGFEEDEMRITKQVMRRRRRRKAFLMPNINTLQLSTGPLPEVNGEDLHPDRKLATIDYPRKKAARRNFHPTMDKHNARPSHGTRLGDMDDLIVAQLASVCAPGRPETDSEAEIFEEEDDSKEDEEIDGNDGSPVSTAQRYCKIDDDLLLNKFKSPKDTCLSADKYQAQTLAQSGDPLREIDPMNIHAKTTWSDSIYSRGLPARSNT